jgi:hypothetical protein
MTAYLTAEIKGSYESSSAIQCFTDYRVNKLAELFAPFPSSPRPIISIEIQPALGFNGHVCVLLHLLLAWNPTPSR